MNGRTIIGICLGGTISVLLYLEYLEFLFITINLAVIYDTLYLLFSGINKKIVLVFSFTMCVFNFYIYKLYLHNPALVIMLITIAQVSDIFQYKVGNLISNKTTIGWISKNKSYEGYIGGFVLTILIFIWLNTFWCIFSVYLLGIMGGLISSAFKRKIGIKDYSNLLGPHGGFVDRIDSIVLPLLFFKFIEML